MGLRNHYSGQIILFARLALEVAECNQQMGCDKGVRKLLSYIRMLRHSDLSWVKVSSILFQKAVSAVSYSFLSHRDELLSNNCLKRADSVTEGTVAAWRQHLASASDFLELAVPREAFDNPPLEKAKRIAEGDLGIYGSHAVSDLRTSLDRQPSGPREPDNRFLYDPLSDYTWPTDKHFKGVLRSAPAGVDVKAIWEVSRFHHLTTLGLCYRKESASLYANAFRDHMIDWIESNPYPYGPNWASTLEVSVRCANWLVGLMCFHDATELNDRFWSVVLSSLACHGHYIAGHLEKLASFSSNHYAGNIAGLFFLGALCPGLERSSEWMEFAARELEHEIVAQTHPDGWHFENSSCYHRFVTEMFYYSDLLGQVMGLDFSDDYKVRLRKMLEVLAEVRKPTGETPQIGDNDSGRFLIFNIHRDKASLNVDYLAKSIQSSELCAQDLATGSRIYGDVGWYLLRSDAIYLLLLAGPKGQNGRGGHDHNHVLSFELNVDGVDVFVDPGTYTYAGPCRNYFRSVRNHNTLSWSGLEPCSFESRQPFVLYEQGDLQLNELTTSPTLDVCCATYYYRDRWHRRRVLLHKSEERIEVEDVCSHRGADLVFVCAPTIAPMVRSDRVQLGPAELKFGDEGYPRIEAGHYSPAYGARVPTNRLVMQLDGCRIQYEIRAVSKEDESRGQVS